MTEEDMATIRSIPWRREYDPEVVIAVVSMWNAGYSGAHIQEILGLATIHEVMKPLSSVRIRTDIDVRRVSLEGRAGVPEHPSWWTPKRTELAKALWEEGDMRLRAIAERLKTNDATIGAKAAEAGWKRAQLSAPKTRAKKASSGIERRVQAIKEPVGRSVVVTALPGTEPKPFWRVALVGECNFILGDERGNMAEALTCAAPATGRYCPAHTALSRRDTPFGNRATAKDLVRRYGRVA